MKAFLMISLVLLFHFSANAQSKTVSQFVAQHEPNASFHFYPSTLRMVNIEHNPDYQRLVRNIKKLSFFTFDKKNTTIDPASFQKIKESLATEKFEQLFAMDDHGNHIYVYAKGDEAEAYISAVENESRLILLDMQGAPHLPSLMKLIQGDFNFEQIADLSSQLFKSDDDAEINSSPQ